MRWTWRRGLSIHLSTIQPLLDALSSSPRLRTPSKPPSLLHKYLFFCTGPAPLFSPLLGDHVASGYAPGARAMPTNPRHPPIRPPHPLARCLPKTHQDLALCTAAPANSAASQSQHPAPTAMPAPGADGGSRSVPSPRPVFRPGAWWPWCAGGRQDGSQFGRRVRGKAC